MIRWLALSAVVAYASFAFTPVKAQLAHHGVTQARGDALSAQSRRRKRVTVRPRYRDDGERPLYSTDRRECRGYLRERNIPEWGGRVLSAAQDCRWVRW